MRKMTGDTGTRLVFITRAQIRHEIDILKASCCLASEKSKLSQNKFDYDFNPGFNKFMSFDKKAVDLLGGGHQNRAQIIVVYCVKE